MNISKALCFFIIIYFIYSPNVFAYKLKFLAEQLPPFHYLDEHQKPAGVLVDVLNAVLKEANFQAEIEFMPFARAYDLASKETDVFLFSLLKTPSRESQFKWVGQIYTNKAFLVGLKKRKNIQLQTLNNAKKYTLGTIRGYYSETFLRQAGFKSKKQLYVTVDYSQLWGMLLKNRIDLILTNTIALETELDSLNINSQDMNLFLEVNDFPSELHIASGLKTSNLVIKRLSNALSDIKRKNIYNEILSKWAMKID